MNNVLKTILTEELKIVNMDINKNNEKIKKYQKGISRDNKAVISSVNENIYKENVFLLEIKKILEKKINNEELNKKEEIIYDKNYKKIENDIKKAIKVSF